MMVMEVNKENYESEVLGNEGCVLVDFWGPSCEPCLELMPAVEKIDEKYSDLKVVKLDSSKNRRLCINHKVMGLPTFIIYLNGEEVERISGKEVNEEALDAMVNKYIKN